MFVFIVFKLEIDVAPTLGFVIGEIVEFAWTFDDVDDLVDSVDFFGAGTAVGSWACAPGETEEGADQGFFPARGIEAGFNAVA